MRHVVVIVSLVLGALLMQGCATPPQYRWYKAGATQSEFSRDSYECQTEAARTYPPNFVTYQLSPNITSPATTNCYSTGSASGGAYGTVQGSGTTTCTTTPASTAQGLTETSDAKRGYRLQAAKA